MIHYYHLQLNYGTEDMEELKHCPSCTSAEHAVAEFTRWLRSENRLQSNKCLKVYKDTDSTKPHRLRENIKEDVCDIGVKYTNTYRVDEVDCPEGALSLP